MVQGTPQRTYPPTASKFDRSDPTETLGFTVSAHLLRHTYATRLEEAGISPKLKQYLMGHSTLEMTQNTYTDVQIEYVNANSDKIKAAFDFNLTTKKH